MKRALLVICILAAFMVVGCKSTGVKSSAAPAKKIDSNVTVSVLYDNGDTKSLAANKAKAQNQIADYMKKDLVNLLKKRVKVKATNINKSSQFKKGNGAYLLSVKVRKYNPGSSAARRFVGFGAGSASMDISFTLKDSSGKVLLAKDDGVGTSGDWRRIARKLNENIIRDIKPKL